MCSLTDFIGTSLGRCGGSVSTATVTGQGASLVDPSVRGGDFWWPPAGTFHGHQRGHQLAITGDFFMATDRRVGLGEDDHLALVLKSGTGIGLPSQRAANRNELKRTTSCRLVFHIHRCGLRGQLQEARQNLERLRQSRMHRNLGYDGCVRRGDSYRWLSVARQPRGGEHCGKQPNRCHQWRHGAVQERSRDCEIRAYKHQQQQQRLDGDVFNLSHTEKVVTGHGRKQWCA